MDVSAKSPAEKSGGKRVRVVTNVAKLDELVGGHPSAIRSMFLRGSLADPAELGDEPQGRLLALEPLGGMHLATRGAISAIARSGAWTGVGFDHGGNAGYNRVLGNQRTMRFRAGVEASKLDGGPVLALTYDRSPWPISALRDELRAVGPGMAIAATFFGDRLVLWFGLQRA
jgi:hypothetical protein